MTSQGALVVMVMFLLMSCHFVMLLRLIYRDRYTGENENSNYEADQLSVIVWMQGLTSAQPHPSP